MIDLAYLRRNWRQTGTRMRRMNIIIYRGCSVTWPNRVGGWEDAVFWEKSMASDKSDKQTAENTVGCLLAGWSLFLTGPMWLVLLFAILNALGDATPTYAWALYWVYVPTAAVGLVISSIFKLLVADK